MADTEKKANAKTKAKDSKLAHFFKGVRTEFRKIIWPDRYTLLKQLVAVLVVAIIVGIIIALVDYASGVILNFLMGL